MSWFKLVIGLLQPPGLIILLLLFGLYSWLVAKKSRAILVLTLSTLLLYSFSIPFCTNKLISYIDQKYQAMTLDSVSQEKTPKAIVVLSAGLWPNSNGLFRILYTAKLANITKLPILVSGGGKNIENKEDSEAASMAKSLEADFHIAGAIWVEGESRNTMENAKFTKQVLEKNNINDIFLVTNSWHMPRAVQEFTKQGINVVAAPVLSNTKSKTMLEQFVPSADELLKSEAFFHEYFGAMWYKLLAMVNSN